MKNILIKSSFIVVAMMVMVSPALASGGSGSNSGGSNSGGGATSGCTRFQTMTTVFGWRIGEFAPSVQTEYAVKPCDKKESISMRYTLTDTTTGTQVVALTMPELVGGVIVPSAGYVVGDTYTVKLDVVSLKNGSTLESKSQSVVAIY